MCYPTAIRAKPGQWNRKHQALSITACILTLPLTHKVPSNMKTERIKFNCITQQIFIYLFLYTKPPLAHRKLSRDVKIAELKKLKKKICKAELLSDCFLVPFFYLLSPEELLVRKSYYCLNTHLQMPVVFIIYYMVYTSSSAKPNSLLTRRLAHTYLKLIFFFLNSLTVCRMPGIPKPVTFPNTNQLFNSHNWHKKLKQNNQFSVTYFTMPFRPILDVQIRHKGQKAVSFLSQT